MAGSVHLSGKHGRGVAGVVVDGCREQKSEAAFGARLGWEISRHGWQRVR